MEVGVEISTLVPLRCVLCTRTIFPPGNVGKIENEEEREEEEKEAEIPRRLKTM